MIRAKLVSILFVTLWSAAVWNHASAAAPSSSQNLPNEKASVHKKTDTTTTKKEEPLPLSSLFSSYPLEADSAAFMFNAANPDTINYARLCTVPGNSSCDSCNQNFRIYNVGTDIPYGVTKYISPSAIANYLQSFGAAADTYYVNLYVQSRNNSCQTTVPFTHCSANKDVGDAGFLCMEAVYDGSTVTSMTQSGGQGVFLETATQLAYVPSTNSIFQCMINSFSGDFSNSNCISTPEAISWAPKGVTFEKVGSQQYVYVAENNGTTGNVYRCSLFPDGRIIGCTATPAIGAPAWLPNSVTFATVNLIRYAYVTDISGNVYKCTLNLGDGSFTACNITPAAHALWTPINVTFFTQGGVQYALVVNKLNNNFEICTINIINGDFTACIPVATIPAFTSPKAIAVATFNSVQYAYVADEGGFVYQCNTGTFPIPSCNPTPPGFPWKPIGVSFATSNGVTSAYVTTSDAFPNPSLYRCNVNPTNGQFVGCIPTPLVGAPPSPVNSTAFGILQ